MASNMFMPDSAILGTLQGMVAAMANDGQEANSNVVEGAAVNAAAVTAPAVTAPTVTAPAVTAPAVTAPAVTAAAVNAADAYYEATFNALVANLAASNGATAGMASLNVAAVAGTAVNAPAANAPAAYIPDLNALLGIVPVQAPFAAPFDAPLPPAMQHPTHHQNFALTMDRVLERVRGPSSTHTRVPFELHQRFDPQALRDMELLNAHIKDYPLNLWAVNPSTGSLLPTVNEHTKTAVSEPAKTTENKRYKVNIDETPIGQLLKNLKKKRSDLGYKGAKITPPNSVLKRMREAHKKARENMKKANEKAQQ